MSIAILHILPEANEMHQQIVANELKQEELSRLAGTESGSEHDHEHGEEGHSFPLAFLIFQSGFFLMLIVNTLFHGSEKVCHAEPDQVKLPSIQAEGGGIEKSIIKPPERVV